MDTKEQAVRPSWVDRDEYPFSSAIANVGGHRIHYVDTAAPGQSGPTLLFLHGNPTWSFVYRDVIRALPASVRCVAPDLPGFGLSDAADDFDGTFVAHADVIERFVDALGLEDVVLVAQDWGGPIGLRLLERTPERFRGVALCNTWAWPVADDPHFARFAGAMGGRVGAFFTRHGNLFVNLMIPIGHRRRRVTRAEMAHYRRALGTARRRGFSAVLPREIVAATPHLVELEAGLSVLSAIPVLIMWGDRDIAFREPELARWRTIAPHAHVEVIEGAGHFLPSDAPAEVAASLRGWLANIPGAAK
ncbi:alpha/beta fold hydrolase [Microbacterium sp. Clip185]|uniref:alpha/beta fold hydrolase n=1 Tax=Microbacterium sp. Clip185 TaxID=3025663 RepID=UPI002366CF1F|nr:alpha/beta fold hydrolase [Microbacterium sp. Clip185]WDG16785.1 alpha/beta fold hydrolase [Microbacterium sp. Clip185]